MKVTSACSAGQLDALKRKQAANRLLGMNSQRNKRGEAERRARNIADPIVVHLRRRLRAVTAEIEEFIGEHRRQSADGRALSSQLRQRGETLADTTRTLMDDIKAHLRYIEDPDDPAVAKCRNMHAHAAGCLNRIRKQLNSSSARESAARAQKNARRDRQTGESSSVYTITGGLPGLGKRR